MSITYRVTYEPEYRFKRIVDPGCGWYSFSEFFDTLAAARAAVRREIGDPQSSFDRGRIVKVSLPFGANGLSCGAATKEVIPCA